MTGPGTNTYLVGAPGEPATVIDPGPDDAAHLSSVLEAAGRVGAIVITHHHLDHAGGAGHLAELCGAPVLGFGGDRAGQAPRVDRRIVGGETINAGGTELVALHTPGHASDHLCLVAPGIGLAFTGDHIMGASTVVIAPPDGDMASYMASLEKLASLCPPVRRLAPGHGPVIEDAASAISAYVSHRLAREVAVLAGLARRGGGRAAAAGEGATVDDLLGEVYPGLDAALVPVARYSLLAHLVKLSDEGRAGRDGEGTMASRWWEL
ncbi:MAG: MBL fold metallo-hydrolase [Acidimicrobiales bacterium]